MSIYRSLFGNGSVSGINDYSAKFLYAART